jgi:hypothetical protein
VRMSPPELNRSTLRKQSNKSQIRAFVTSQSNQIKVCHTHCGQSKSSRNSGTALLHCNGRTHGTFTVGLMRAHYPAVVGSTGGMVAFHWMPSLVAKRVPWRQGTARSGECGGWVMCVSVQKPLSLPATCRAASSAHLAQ